MISGGSQSVVVNRFIIAIRWRLRSLAILGFSSGTCCMIEQPPQKASTKDWPGCIVESIIGRISSTILALLPLYFIVLEFYVYF